MKMVLKLNAPALHVILLGDDALISENGIGIHSASFRIELGFMLGLEFEGLGFELGSR